MFWNTLYSHPSWEFILYIDWFSSSMNIYSYSQIKPHPKNTAYVTLLSETSTQIYVISMTMILKFFYFFYYSHHQDIMSSSILERNFNTDSPYVDAWHEHKIPIPSAPSFLLWLLDFWCLCSSDQVSMGLESYSL